MPETSTTTEAPELLTPNAGAFPPAEPTGPFSGGSATQALEGASYQVPQFADPDDADETAQSGPETDQAETPGEAPGTGEEGESSAESGQESSSGEAASDSGQEDTSSDDSASDPEFDAEILERAGRYGFSDEEARAFGSPENLQSAMTTLDRQLSALGREELGRQSDHEPQPLQPQPPQSPQASQPQAPDPNSTPTTLPEKLKLELDPNEYDEGLIKTVNSINDHYDGIIRQQEQHLKMAAEAIMALHQQINETTGQTQAEEYARFHQEMDAFFTGLGDEFRDVFGKGEMRTLSPNSPESTARNALVEEMHALRIADARLNRPQSSWKELQQRALHTLHGDKIKSIARREINEKIKNRRGKAISRPAGRQTKSSDPITNAVKFVEEFSKQHRIYERDDDVEFG